MSFNSINPIDALDMTLNRCCLDETPCGHWLILDTVSGYRMFMDSTPDGMQFIKHRASSIGPVKSTVPSISAMAV